MKYRLNIVGFCCLLSFSWITISFADIYMSVDKEGVPFFTNIPSKDEFKLLYKERYKIQKNSIMLRDLDGIIKRAASKHNVDYPLVKAVIKVESDFNPHAVSNAGAMGLMQLMPGTAEMLKVKDVFHPGDNIDGGVRLLKLLLSRFDGNISLALAAYHAGAERVSRYQDIPPIDSTRKFVTKVIKWMIKYQEKEKAETVRNENENYD